MKLKKGDLIIVVIVLIVVLGWLTKSYILPDPIEVKQAVIEIDGTIYDKVVLKSNNLRKEIPITLTSEDGLHSTIITEGDKIWVEESTCPNKICVKTGKISKSSQSIVCLPGKVIIYIESAESAEVDDMVF